ncbi:MAG: hypothetical protein ABI420_00225 [Opitutaceae bacterium]
MRRVPTKVAPARKAGCICNPNIPRGTIVVPFRLREFAMEALTS